MFRKLLFLTSCLALGCVMMQAQGPNKSGTYYQAANGEMGRELKTALCGIIERESEDVTSYDGLIGAYVKTDTRSDGYVRDWYSNATNYRHDTDKAGSYSKEGDCYNREHSIPQSWFSEASPMKSDIVHVFPTDGFINGKRSSFPFGEVASIEYQSKNGYSKLGPCKIPGYTDTVFEPNDEVKGDIARIYFYMATCYENRITNWTKGSSNIQNDKYKPFPDWQMSMLMRWSEADPVDAVELARNDSVFVVQGNRNPFVDYPRLEQLIWGNSTDVAFVYDNYEEPQSGGDDSGEGGDGGEGGDDPVVTPSEGENVFAKITSTGDLDIGASYLIVCESKDVAMAEHATTGTSRNRVEVTISSNQITTTVGTIGKPYEMVLGGSSSDGYTLYDPVAKTYLARTGSGNTLNAVTDATMNQAKWTISFSNGNAVITNKNSSNYTLAYNSNNTMFRAYSSNQTAIQLYKKQQATSVNMQTITSTNRVTVHSLQGVLIRVAANYKDALQDLPKGFYIINGRKIVIR